MMLSNIKKDYPLMTTPFIIFTDRDEYQYVSRLFNVLNSAEASLSLYKINISRVTDFRELAAKSCLQYAACGFKFNDLRYFLKKNFDFSGSELLYIGPEGLFASREEYNKWQKLYGLLKPISRESLETENP